MDINQQQTDFLASLNGELSPENAARLLELADAGDTGAPTPDQDGAPSATTGEASPKNPDSTPASQAAEGNDGKAATTAADTPAPDGEPNPDSTVILAKDGKHTIPFEKLQEAREAATTWRTKAEEAQAELERLRAQVKPADGAPTQLNTDQLNAAADQAVKEGIDPAVFGDFSDEAIAKGIATIIDQRMAKIMEHLDTRLAPLAERQANDAVAEHKNAILQAHPDAGSIVQSRELRAWIDSQPTFLRSAYDQVLDAGSTKDVIELIDGFKKATGVQSTPAGGAGNAPTPEAVKRAAAAAIANAQSSVPTSLTDLPGGRPGAAAGREEQWAQMDGVALLEAMSDTSPEQIERFLNRRV